MPTDDLVFDPGAIKCRTDAFLEQTVRAERLLAVQPNRWEEEVAIALIE